MIENYLPERRSFSFRGGHEIADMFFFAGDSDIFIPYKRNKSTELILRGSHNRDYRPQLIMSKCGIGYYVQNLSWSLPFN